MDPTSPTKRRALAALDVNTSAPTSLPPASPNTMVKPNLPAVASPLKMEVQRDASSPAPASTLDSSTKKRHISPSGGGSGEPPAKKLCFEEAGQEDAPMDVEVTTTTTTTMTTTTTTTRRRSVSPAASEVFDNSTITTSQNTTITEPDLVAPVVANAGSASIPVTSAAPSFVAPSPPAAATPRVLTREETKQRAETIRLRLSLARYKVETNQVNVPLEQLQIRPVPGMARSRTPLPSMSAHTVQRATPGQQWYRRGLGGWGGAVAAAPAADEEVEEEPVHHELPVLPRLPPAAPGVCTPRRSRFVDEDLTSSAIRGGAAKGLLSLSQG